MTAHAFFDKQKNYKVGDANVGVGAVCMTHSYIQAFTPNAVVDLLKDRHRPVSSCDVSPTTTLLARVDNVGNLTSVHPVLTPDLRPFKGVITSIALDNQESMTIWTCGRELAEDGAFLPWSIFSFDYRVAKGTLDLTCFRCSSSCYPRHSPSHRISRIASSASVRWLSVVLTSCRCGFATIPCATRSTPVPAAQTVHPCDRQRRRGRHPSRGPTSDDPQGRARPARRL